MLVTTPGGIQVYITVIDNGKRRILDQDPETISDSVRESDSRDYACCSVVVKAIH
jgi:hypothetical protein